jgi:hypothetical protein
LTAGTFTAGANTNVGGDWTNYGATFTHSSGTVTFNGSSGQNINGSSSTTFYNLTINKSGTATLGINQTVAGNLTITAGTFDLVTYTANRSSAGGTLTVAATLRLSGTSGGPAGSNFPNNYSTLTMTSGTVEYYKADGGQTIFSTPAYNNLTLSNTSGTDTAGGALTVNGTITTTSGGILDMSAYALGGILSGISNSGTIKTACLSSALPSGKTWGGDVQYYGAGGQIVISGNYSSCETITAGNYTAGGDITASTIFDNGGGSNVAAILDMLTYNLTTPGTFGNSGATVKFGGATNGHPATGGGLIIYNGSGQTIGAGTYAGDLTIAETSGGATLGGDVTVGGMLTFTSGKINTGAYTLILPTTATISGASTSNYVYGNVQRAFTSGSSSFTFPIGDASLYDPLALTFTGITTGGNVTASVTGSDCSSIGTSDIDSAKSVNHCWTLTNVSTVFSSYAATFNYGNGSDVDSGATPANFTAQEYTGSTWSTLTLSGTPSGTSTSVSGVTVFGNFAIGNVAGGSLTILKQVSTDGSTWYSGTASMIPNRDVYYRITVTNTSSTKTVNTVSVTDVLSPYVAYKVSSLTFTDGSPTSGLSAPAVTYLNQSNAGYTPATGGGGAPSGYDGNVSLWTATFTGGIMAVSSSFTLVYHVWLY